MRSGHLGLILESQRQHAEARTSQVGVHVLFLMLSRHLFGSQVGDALEV